MEDCNEGEGLTLPQCSRAWTMRSSATKQTAINFTPSRQSTKNRRSNSEICDLLENEGHDHIRTEDTSERQADYIVREMEMNQQLMEDNPEAEDLRRVALRDLPQGLTMKRHVRAKLSVSVSLRSKRKPLSFAKRLKYRISFNIKKLKEHVRNFIFSIELWYEAIRTVEGHFGSAVGSYFHFLRWLFIMNLFLSIIMISFVIVPQILHDIRYNITNQLQKEATSFWDFISGKGNLEDSILFYGHYSYGDISVNKASNFNMTFSYFFTMLVLYLFFFIVLCFRTADSYRRHFIETAGGLGHIYATKLFCGWDFGISTQEGAKLNAKSIYNEFKELLNEQNKKKEKQDIFVWMTQCTINLIATILVLGFIAAIEYGLWWLLSARINSNMSQESNLWNIGVSVIVTITVAMCPIIFSHIVRAEYYLPRTSLYVTLARTFLLDVSTLLMLIVFWSHENSTYKCWESALGQESYRLMLFDVILSIFLLPLFEIIRGYMFKKLLLSSPEFNLAYNSLTLIYSQAILWFGMVFSPLLVVMVTMKYFVLFYIKKTCAIYACQPARKVWRAAQTQTVLYMFVNLSLFTAIFTIGSLFLRSSSQHCGPFREYEYVYLVLTEGLFNLSHHHNLSSCITYITKPGVIAFVLLFLSVGVYYMRARSLAHKSMVRLLRDMLVLEARDKEFLLLAIAKVSNGEWLYSPKMDDVLQSNESHTWKYLQDINVRKPSNYGFQFERPDTSHLNQSDFNKSRPRSYLNNSEHRPNSHFQERPKSYDHKGDGDTDSSFSWQGSSGHLSDPNGADNLQEGTSNKWL